MSFEEKHATRIDFFFFLIELLQSSHRVLAVCRKSGNAHIS